MRNRSVGRGSVKDRGSSWVIPGAALTERRRRIGASAIGRYQRARQRWHGWALGQWVAGAVNVWGRGQGSSEGRSQSPPRPPRSMMNWTMDDADGSVGVREVAVTLRKPPWPKGSLEAVGSVICQIGYSPFFQFAFHVSRLFSESSILTSGFHFHHQHFFCWKSWPSGYWPPPLSRMHRDPTDPAPSLASHADGPPQLEDGTDGIAYFQLSAQGWERFGTVSSWLPSSPSRTERKQRVAKESGCF